jgi:hypothetical protein
VCFRLTGNDPYAYSVYPDFLMKQLIGSTFHSGDVMHVSSVLYLMWYEWLVSLQVVWQFEDFRVVTDTYLWFLEGKFTWFSFSCISQVICVLLFVLEHLCWFSRIFMGVLSFTTCTRKHFGCHTFPDISCKQSMYLIRKQIWQKELILLY